MNLILHGASTSTSTLAGTQAWTSLVGSQSLAHVHFPMFNGLNPDGSGKPLIFNVALADALWKANQLLLMTWGTQNLSTHTACSPADYLAGKYDPYLVAFARSAAAWRHPFFLRLNHEMNGWWMPWSYKPDDFVRMWRHTALLFRQEGATNVTWVWCPNQLSRVDSGTSTAANLLPAYYPGDDVVDWAGFDCYNKAASEGGSWQSFVQVADLTYQTVAQIAPTKPQILAEFGSHDSVGDKPAWLRDALSIIPTRYPLIRAISYYPVAAPPANWRLLTTDGTAQAYSAALRAGPYALTLPSLPPDLRPLLPLQSAFWGYPTPDLSAQLATSTAANTLMQASLTAATTQTTLDTATIADLVAQIDQVTSTLGALRTNIRGFIEGAGQA